ncbi:MAG: BspA family leucine-rich repeat surface protein, partial [Actinomycetes bacterium]
MTGLTGGTAYTFTATANNGQGVGLASAPFGPVTPMTPEFKATWDTGNTSSGSSASDQIALPLVNGGSYNFTAEWGDGQTTTITSWNDPDATHTYASGGQYTVTIKGTTNGWSFNNSGDRLKIKHVSSWGSLKVGDTGGAFYGAANLTADTTDVLDTTGMTNMENMFRGASLFNQDISGWSVSSVTTMSGMFQDATSFNQPMTGAPLWTTYSLTNTSNMFKGATAFNQNVGNWAVWNVTTAAGMFDGVTLSTANYDALLIGWLARAQEAGTQNVTFSGGSSTYSSGPAAAARASLISTYHWTITDGGLTNLPGAPTITVATAGEGAVTLAWTAPSDGGSPITGYAGTTVEDGTKTCASAGDTLTCQVNGLTNGTPYTFTVTATNANGSGPASVASAAVVPGAPGIPGAPIAAPRDGGVGVTVAAPADGGTPAFYTVTAVGVDPAKTCTVTGRSGTCVVTGLDNTTAYTFTSTATNDAGTSAASSASNSITPTAAFAATWNTSNTSSGSSAANQIRLPLLNGGTYDFTVYWGDGTTSAVTAANDPDATHTYASAGTYSVAITGTLNGWGFVWGGDRVKILDVSSWGPLKLGNGGYYFSGTSNMTSSATDVLDLTGTTNLRGMFSGAAAFDGDISGWDVSGVTDTGEMFTGATAFNRDIGGWNVSHVTNMYGMFQNASAFNQDIGGWDVSAVTNMGAMFWYASAFNQNIGNWNVSAVNDMYYMFLFATSFNQDISAWDVSALHTTGYMFYGAAAFDQNIGSWDVSAVTWADAMFQGVTLSTANYDALLTGWAARILQPGVGFNGGGSHYSAGAAADARSHMIADFGWNITDGGPVSVPDAPTITGATGGNGQVTVTWTAPANTGGAAITGYTATWTSTAPAASGTFACSTSLTCEITGLTNGTAYTVTMTATNEMGDSAPSAPSASVTPTQADQAPLSIDSPDTKTYGSGNLTLTTTGGSGGGAVTFAVTTAGSANCAIVGDQLSISSNAGTSCGVTASKAGDTNYNPTSSGEQTVSVTTAEQDPLSFDSPSSKTFGTNLGLSATGGSGSGAITYQVTAAGTAGCTLVGADQLASTGDVGTSCAVSATKAGDTNYNPTSAGQTVTVTDKAEQDPLSITSPDTVTYGVGTLGLDATGGSGGGALTYQVTTAGSATCSITGSTLSITGDAGTFCGVTATKAGDTNFNPTSSGEQTITVTTAEQDSLSIDSPDTKTYGSGNLTLTTTGGSGGGAVTFAVTSAGSANCVIVGDQLSISSNAGTTCGITASKAGDTNYNSTTSGQQTITVTTAEQDSLSIDSPDTKTYGSGNLTLTTTGGSGGGAVTFAVTSAGSANCVIVGDQLSISSNAGT